MVSRVEVIPGKHEHVSMLLLATTEHILCVVSITVHPGLD